MTALHALLQSAVDYAGSYPPANLGLSEAVINYARARSGPHSWMLGRLVLPAASLEEFEQLIPTVVPTSGETLWPLSVIVTNDPGIGDWGLGIKGGKSEVERFNRDWQGKAVIASMEFAPLDGPHVERVTGEMPAGVDAFIEVPVTPHLEEVVSTISASRVAAKIRTGGVVANTVPSEADVIRFMYACAHSHVAFKATAGLHHAIRGSYPLTYDASSPMGTMHGFLNVALAAALVYTGATPEVALEALRETSPEAFDFSGDFLRWRDTRLPALDLANMRHRLFRSFGSCAFDEPAGELEEIKKGKGGAKGS